MPLVQVTKNYACSWANFGVKQTPWGLPVVIGALWFVFPAINFGSSEKTSDVVYKFKKGALGETPILVKGGGGGASAPTEYVFESAGIGVTPTLVEE
eukprot:CAMPEP_0114351438 /NCGR_PEP_ID=MMETSP0101-20121206/17188_1 /TAXON_ID=38822 ORGANISM="Pteridomonas danica, Strain PT" /NCGR_SAMPLE_ID=MMETSP0101 /ASSEMBLY_ACC=CAM_ASM_000211 /LENGTH=96 /DNA_ID=CAMNT_0001491323 /DNA_START=1 /DNA_END=291 /DNA_ORIENTATION=+